MIKKILRFVVLLAVVLLVAFLLHSYFYKTYKTVLKASYLGNFLMTVFVFTLLNVASKRLFNQLGFLFLGGTFLKFILFFTVLKPYFNTVENQNVAFVLFFIPYTIASVLEVIYLIKLLNPKKSYKFF